MQKWYFLSRKKSKQFLRLNGKNISVSKLEAEITYTLLQPLEVIIRIQYSISRLLLTSYTFKRLIHQFPAITFSNVQHEKILGAEIRKYVVNYQNNRLFSLLLMTFYMHTHSVQSRVNVSVFFSIMGEFFLIYYFQILFIRS